MEWLFGRKKGTGESIWDIKRSIGVLSTAFHMDYENYADDSHRTYGHNGAKVTSWQVILSGFFDTVGLYDQPTLEHEAIARKWVERFGHQEKVFGRVLDISSMWGEMNK